MKGDETRDEQQQNKKEKKENKEKEKEPPNQRNNLPKYLHLYYEADQILSPRFAGARKGRAPIRGARMLQVTATS